MPKFPSKESFEKKMNGDPQCPGMPVLITVS